jgi:sulfonate transport system permease protein
VLSIVLPVLSLVLWEMASRREWIDPRFYPAPTKCFEAARTMWESGELGQAIRSTLYIVIVGFLWGSAAGFVIGTVMGVSSWVRVALEPFLNALYVVPKLALLPIFLTILGFGSAPKIVLCAITVFFFVWIATMEAIATVPAGYREAATSFGVSRWEMFRHVHLPASLPAVFVALRIGMGVAILVTIAAEFVVGGEGLGYVIFNARALFLLERAYAGILIVAVLGIALSAAVVAIGRMVTPWEQGSRRRGKRVLRVG